MCRLTRAHFECIIMFSPRFLHVLTDILAGHESSRSTSGALEKGRSMPGRCSSPRRCLTTDRKFKADSLISSLVPTTVHHHPALSPTVCSASGVTILLEKLSFHEHQHGTRGRQQGDFRPFQPASLAGRISFTNRAPLLWNMLPR